MTNLNEFSSSLSTFGRRSRAVTPSDTVDLASTPKALTVLTSGTLAIIPVGNEDADVVSYDAVGVGFSPPFLVRRVMATNTTAVVATVDDN